MVSLEAETFFMDVRQCKKCKTKYNYETIQECPACLYPTIKAPPRKLGSKRSWHRNQIVDNV